MVRILGLRDAERILDSVAASVPPEQRAEIEEVRDFARIARENLDLADFLASVREPIAVEKQVIAGEVPPLDTFAVAVAAVTLLFVTVLLVSGSLALERRRTPSPALSAGSSAAPGCSSRKPRSEPPRRSPSPC